MLDRKLSRWKLLLIAGISIVAISGLSYGIINRPFTTLATIDSSQSPGSQLASEEFKMVVYRTPTCGCCKGWVEHIKQNNFQVTDMVKSEAEIEDIRTKHNLPKQLASCHTAEINGYLVEGHVPAEDIQQLMAQKPDVAGIAVPGMPIGTPGMEMGDRQQSFDVLAFKADGQIEVFNSYKY